MSYIQQLQQFLYSSSWGQFCGKIWFLNMLKFRAKKEMLPVTCLSGFVHRLILRMIKSQRVHICLVWHQNSWRWLLQLCQHRILMLFVAISFSIQSCKGDHRGNTHFQKVLFWSHHHASSWNQIWSAKSRLHGCFFFLFKYKIEKVLHWILTLAWATAKDNMIFTFFTWIWRLVRYFFPRFVHTTISGTTCFQM